MEPIDPYTLIGKQVPAADGEDYGHLIVGFQASPPAFLTVPSGGQRASPCTPTEALLSSMPSKRATGTNSTRPGEPVQPAPHRGIKNHGGDGPQRKRRLI